jgi:hypothetical protein
MSESDISLDMSVVSSDFDSEQGEEMPESGTSFVENGEAEMGIQPYMFEPCEPVNQDDSQENQEMDPEQDGDADANENSRRRTEENSW